MAGLVLAVIAECVMSDAVTVRLPAVLSVTLKVCVPAANAPLAGRPALPSLEVMPTTSLVLIKFQLASTALTVTVNAVPAVWAIGAPVLPVPVPAAAASPGTSNCSLAKAPALTVIGGLVFAALVGSVTSVAVIVQVPDVLLVRLKDLVPETKAVLAGSTAFGSVELRLTRSVMLLTRFQLASTALTVTL